MSSELQYRPDIDGLRAVAVLSVVAFHAFPQRVPGGFVGVDVFFVISGFLITGILRRSQESGRFTFGDFYARRARRIFPALTLLLAVTLGAGWALLHNDELKSLATHAAAGAGFVANLVLWREAGYFDAAIEYKPLMHLWSLGVEEQFYLLWPALMWGAWRLRISRGWAIAVVLVASFSAAVVVSRTDTVGAFYSPLTRFWELMIGAALAWVAPSRQPDADGTGRGSLVREVLALAGLVAVVAASLVLSRTSPFPGVAGLVPTVGAALLIGAGPHTLVNRRVLAHPALVAIGLISYPLYLWHWPLLVFTRVVKPEWMLGATPAVLAALAVVLAWLTYRWLERPIRARQTSAPAIALALAAVAVVALFSTRLDPIAISGRYAYLPNVETRLLFRNPHLFKDSESCLADFGWSPLAPDKCARQSERPAIIIAGDSHAGQYYPGVGAIGARTMVIWNGGCPPLRGFTVEHKPCDARWSMIEQYIAAQKSYDPVVLLGAHTGGYLNPSFLDGEPSHLYLPQYQTVDLATLPQAFASSYVESVRALRRQGFRVGVLLDGPAFRHKSTECLARGGEACVTDRAVNDARQAVVKQAMLALTAEDPGVQVFDPTEFLCPSGQCTQYINGTLAYWDDDHWNVHGSRIMAARLVAWVRDRFGVDALAPPSRP